MDDNTLLRMKIQLSEEADSYVKYKNEGESYILITKNTPNSSLVYEFNLKRSLVLMQLYLRNPDNPQLLDMVGYCEASVPPNNPTVLYINWLKTFKEFRGKGYATSLLNTIEEVAKTAGCRAIKLHSFEHRNSFYSEIGYEKTPTCKYSAYWTLVPMHKNLESSNTIL